ncbi:RDD family protein [Lysobacter sp. TY2-98]|nr:RDD family protein [Lysobacter sp. TY2-98]
MEMQNPYSAGDAVIAAGSQRVHTAENAGKGRRFLTMLIDYAVYFVLVMLVMIPVIVVAGEDAVQGGRAYAVSVPVFVLYWTLFEGLFGRTVGKFVCGTRVVTERGAAPSMGQALGRTLSRMIPFEAFSVLFSEDATGWHDSIAKTKVVRAR